MIGKTSAGTSAKEEKTVTAGTAQKVVTPSNGKLLSKVTINPTPSQAKTATPTAAQQTIKPDSGKLLSQVLVNAVPDSEKKGLYVWKKFQYVAGVSYTNPSFKMTATSGASKLVLTNCTFDCTKIVDWKTFFDGFAYTIIENLQNATKFYWWVNSETTYEITGFTALSASSCELALKSGYTVAASHAQSGNTYSYSGTKVISKEQKTFLDFVVSDNASAYPDGGTQGGYWYEKVKNFMFGLTKEAHGSFILSTDTKRYTLEHNLGAIPKFVVVYTNDSLKGHQYTVRSMMFVDRSSFDSTTTNNSLAMAELYNSASHSSFEVFNKLGETAPMGTFDENSLPLHKSSSNSFKAGATYYWQVMA